MSPSTVVNLSLGSVAVFDSSIWLQGVGLANRNGELAFENTFEGIRLLPALTCGTF
jgi:hypothetical protein